MGLLGYINADTHHWHKNQLTQNTASPDVVLHLVPLPFIRIIQITIREALRKKPTKFMTSC